VKAIARPVTRVGRVIIEATRPTGRLAEVHVERWSTDLLGVEAWCVVEAGAERHARWFTTPGVAAAYATDCFTVAGYGTPPCSAATIAHLRPIRPTGTWIADGVRS
jgi:hypothetical protein